MRDVEMDIALCSRHNDLIVCANRINSSTSYRIAGCGLDYAGDFRDATDSEYAKYLPVFLRIEWEDTYTGRYAIHPEAEIYDSFEQARIAKAGKPQSGHIYQLTNAELEKIGLITYEMPQPPC